MRSVLSDQNRKLPLHVAALGNMGSSSLEPESNGQGTDWIRGTVDVQCDTLDNIVARLNLESIDWLKIDVERHEIPVLEGAQETLSRAKNVILEVSRGNEASRQCFLRSEEHTSELQSRQYLVCRLLLEKKKT